MRHYLVVDDNQAFAENLAEILGDQGATATVTTSPAEALEHVGKTRFDALISDMRMPDISGAELVRRARLLDPGLPVVVITGYTREAELEAARAEGLLAVLPKPAPIRGLLDILEAARRDGLVAMVENDASLADQLGALLRERGFSCVVATSADETARLRPVEPFVAVVDVPISGGRDREAMENLAHRFPQLPLFVMAGSPNIRPPVRVSALFRKPLDPSLVVDAIERQYERVAPRPAMSATPALALATQEIAATGPFSR